MRFPHFILAIAASILVLPGQCATDIEIFASEFAFPARFYRVNPDLGKAVQIGTTRFLPGLDFRANGMLYGSSAEYYSVATADGTAARIGALPDLLVSIAFSPGDQLFGVSNDGLTLFEMDPNTGSSLRSVPITGTTHSSGTLFPGEINGIDFAPDGTLYGIGFGLYSINPLSGVATRITPLGQQVSGNLFLDLDFGQDGQLRAATFDSATDGASNLYRIDPVTGLGQLVGSMGYEIAGLASVPEPSTYSLFIAGGLVVFVLSRWKATHAAPNPAGRPMKGVRGL